MMRRRTSIGLAICALVLAAPAAWAGSVPTAGGTYQLAVTKSGMCIDVVGGSTASGGLLQQWGCVSTATWQQWRVVAVGSAYQLVNVNSGKCIDVPSSSTTSGTRLQQWNCGDAAKLNQLWRFTASGSGTYQIVSVATGLCISDEGASTASGASIIEETCTANTNKQWSFNLLSSGTATVAADGTGTYRTVQAAVDAVPAGNTSRVTITIKAGTYRESVVIPSNKPNITLQGLGGSASNTVVVNNKSAGQYGTHGSATVYVQSANFVATNITFVNDLDESTVTSGAQALALDLAGDRATLSNVRLLADQDTFLINNNVRAYITNSYVEGTVDFIYGGGTAVFNACSIYEKRTTGGPITAAATPATQTYGFLFYRSTITGAANNVTTLGRPWGAAAQVLYRESSLSATIKVAQPWQDMGENPWQNARFLEYKNTGSGATVNGNRAQLSDSAAANYTPQKYLAGSDGWNPT